MAGVYEPTGRTPPSLPVVVTPCGRPPCVARADLSCAPVARSPCVRNPRSNALADCCTGTRSSLQTAVRTLTPQCLMRPWPRDVHRPGCHGK
jgi:hypothetical protein